MSSRVRQAVSLLLAVAIATLPWMMLRHPATPSHRRRSTRGLHVSAAHAADHAPPPPPRPPPAASQPEASAIKPLLGPAATSLVDESVDKATRQPSTLLFVGEGAAGTALHPRRLLPLPQFNLSWTRGAAPPHSEGWEPSRSQRAALPERDVKVPPPQPYLLHLCPALHRSGLSCPQELYFNSCAVVGSSGVLRRSYTPVGGAGAGAGAGVMRMVERGARSRGGKEREWQLVCGRSGYGAFIDAHDLVIRFNGAPAGVRLSHLRLRSAAHG
jgi:hypothetical protein